MRILVAGPARGRLGPAARALGRRGHEVHWLGAGAEGDSAVAPLRGLRELASHRADVALADGSSPARAALLARLARADALLLAPAHAEIARWGPADRWAAQSARAFGLVEPAEAAAFRAAPGPLDPERLALWSDEPPIAAPEPEHLDTEILERAAERALARQRGGAPRAAFFVDRDGTLVREVGYLADPADLELLPGAADALRAVRAAGHPVVVVSNQSGVGRGLFPAASVYEAMARLRTLLRAHDAEPDAIYFCPHRPDAGCPCRKPAPGLLERAADDLRLSLRHSVMVGDKLLDAATGRAAGGQGVLVRTGYGRDEEQRIGGPEEPRPDAVVDSVGAAAAWWLAQRASAAAETR